MLPHTLLAVVMPRAMLPPSRPYGEATRRHACRVRGLGPRLDHVARAGHRSSGRLEQSNHPRTETEKQRAAVGGDLVDDPWRGGRADGRTQSRCSLFSLQMCRRLLTPQTVSRSLPVSVSGCMRLRRRGHAEKTSAMLAHSAGKIRFIRRAGASG
jgi:hypothetical protein